MSARLTPTNLAHIGDELAIAWNDGTESFIGLETLRRNCPCAMCGGEPDVLGHIQRPVVTYTPQSFVLRGWQIVGGYAVQPGWGDGHSTGLYTFPHLRKLAEAAT